MSSIISEKNSTKEQVTKLEVKQQTRKPEPVLTQEEKKENENAFPHNYKCYCTSHSKSHSTSYQTNHIRQVG